jgi:hypothetical protein
MIQARSEGVTSPSGGAQQTLGCGATRKPQAPAELTRSIRKEISRFARKLARDHRAVFAANPNLRKRAGQFLTALLPPKPKRRGRPGIESVTTAVRLLRRFRCQYPEDQPAQRWHRVYPLAIYTNMS